jgi:hypothetical protein
MEYPSRSVDVHMDTDGNDFSCQECHVTESHAIPGNSLGVSPGGTSHFSCAKCHEDAPHAQSRLNKHAEDISCQACHIPFYAKEVPTKLSWDWSTAGQEIEAAVDENGKHGQRQRLQSWRENGPGGSNLPDLPEWRHQGRKGQDPPIQAPFRQADL